MIVLPHLEQFPLQKIVSNVTFAGSVGEVYRSDFALNERACEMVPSVQLSSALTRSTPNPLRHSLRTIKPSTAKMFLTSCHTTSHGAFEQKARALSE